MIGAAKLIAEPAASRASPARRHAELNRIFKEDMQKR